MTLLVAIVSGSLSAWPRTVDAQALISADGVWTLIDVSALQARRAFTASPWIRPEKFLAVEMDPGALQPRLDVAPMRFTIAAEEHPVFLTLPKPDGSFERFAIMEWPVAEPALEDWLAAQGWPMRTYAGHSLDTPGASVHLDWGGPGGFHAMVLSPGATYFIDPYWRGDDRLYATYYKKDYRATAPPFNCEVTSDDQAAFGASESVSALLTGGNLRTYRTAVAGTVEYTTFHGGTQAQGQAAIVTMMTRINGIFIRDAAITMMLVANNIDIVFAAEPDGYTSGSVGAMLSQNPNIINGAIGHQNYDIGHVVDHSGSNSGVANLGVVCGPPPQRARGATTHTNPINDPFQVDYVSHEMGHQYSASHTWNGTNGSCTAGQFVASTAYEAGSGSTIMAYAGICGADNLQANGQANFHNATINQILNFANAGGDCFVATPNANPNAPTVTAGPNFTIPMNTPFELTATNGADADGDTPLTYSWEQFDPGTRAPLATGDDGVQPIFRPFPPTTNPTRVFPNLNNLVSGTPSVGETLPITNRTMNFRVTIRDNNAMGGRIGAGDMTVTSTTTSGPLAVTSPNGGETLTSGLQALTWDVAGTTDAPVSATNVDIFLSTDGGFTYPVVLATGTPNDGSQSVTLPGLNTTTARIKVKGSGNAFFDISDANFTIQTPVPAVSEKGSVVFLLLVAGALLFIRQRRRSVKRG